MDQRPKRDPEAAVFGELHGQIKSRRPEMHAEAGDISSQKIWIKSLSDGRLRYLEGKVGPGIRRLKQDPLFPRRLYGVRDGARDPGSLVRCSDTYG